MMIHRLFFIAHCVFSFAILTPKVFAQSPDDELWDSFIRWNPGEATPPEDEILGPLANLRNPNPLWAEALAVCDDALLAIREGRTPAEQLHPSVRVPLSLEFENVLAEGGREIYPRYAVPEYEVERIILRLRLADSEGVQLSDGYIYLSAWEGRWFIDRWSQNFSEYPGVGKWINAEPAAGVSGPQQEARPR